MLQVEYGIELTYTLQLAYAMINTVQHLYYQHKYWIVQLV